MKVLLDSCVWSGAAQALRSFGHDVEVCSEWASDPGDSEILEHAWKQRRVLVTIDKDFGELAVIHDRAHSGIIRLAFVRAHEQGALAGIVLERYGSELLNGAIITVEPTRIRIRTRGGESS